MKLFTLGSLSFAMALALGHAAQAQGLVTSTVSGKTELARMKGSELEFRARVVELDLAKRTAVVRDPKGKLTKMDVPASVNNLDKVQVGDELVIRYASAIAVSLEPRSKAGSSGIRERVESSASATTDVGGLPGRTESSTVEMLVIIKALDAKANTATLRGVHRTFTVPVPESVDIKKLKVGDEVRVAMVEASAVSVEHAASAPASPASAAKKIKK
ncbi:MULTISPECIES: hypothetical protein [Roseateles]|uniref:DUF5666 domain-containing protein n=1 Tax=Roseateles albus TaxID=2987525 RepID=A0ABT5KJW8_9BURK|nr:MULTISPECIES: hypothetical protein [Roseateles]MCV2360943.1 hypothetical protein [Paucibacter sp. TC2R-5]MDC8773131.1 hypothetical protein [Roseateles albus]